MSEQLETGIEAAIEWEPDDEVMAQFANHALISFDGTSYYIRFYQVLPPVTVPAGESPVVKGRHVVTLAISANSMSGIVKAMQRILEQSQPKDME